MRSQINREELRREWVAETWYDKTYVVIGVFMSWWMIAAFIVGFVATLVEEV